MAYLPDQDQDYPESFAVAVHSQLLLDTQKHIFDNVVTVEISNNLERFDSDIVQKSPCTHHNYYIKAYIKWLKVCVLQEIVIFSTR